MFSKKKIEDQFDKILNTEDISQKAILLKKQIDYFKSQKPDFEYEYKDFLKCIEEFQNSQNYDYNLLWLQLINKIIILNSSFKKKYFKPAMKIIFSQNNLNNINNKKEKKKEEIYKTIIETINVFTNKCEDIFECDNYFQNTNRIKELLKLLIIHILPYFYNRSNNVLLLMILNLFININKNIANKKYLKSNYFSVIFNLLIEILCFQSLYYSFKVLDLKTKKNKKKTIDISNYSYLENIIDLNNNNNEEKEEDKTGIINFIENTTKPNLFDLIDKSNNLFNLYLNLNEKNNLNTIVNYQILMKIFLIHCMESKFNEKNCIEFFKLIINNFKMNKILKMITESFDDEIFNLFYITPEENDSEASKDPNINMSGMTKLSNNKLKSINIFFYLCEYRTKEIESKNYYNQFISKFNGLRNKLLENKEYINNGLFILINLLLNDILSKNNKSINFEEEIIIITLIKCVMKYIIKTNINDMLDSNKNNIDNFVNLLIDSFGVSLSEKIWKELMVLIKYYYFELSKHNTKMGIEQIKIILKKMLKLKINGNYKFDENLFYDILNKICDNKNKNHQINDFLLYSVYIKNKFKSSIYFDKNIKSCTEFFIFLIKEKYNSFETIDSMQLLNEIIKNNEFKKKYNSEELLDILANYLLIYFNTYSKYENKNIELFLYKNFIHLNFYFSTKKNLQSQYIRLVVKNLNNTNDINYYQCLLSYLISLHANQSNFIGNKENYDHTLNLYKKIIIKLIKELSESSQVEKLDFLFESIFNRLYACISDEIDYNILKNILEIFRHTSITKYGEILINNKPTNILKVDNYNDHYLNVGQNNYTSIIVGNNKSFSKKVGENWCIVDIKELFSILIKLLKKENINMDFKEKILNFIKEKVNDIFFFNKLNIDSFLEYVIDLDKDNLKNYILYMEKSDMIISINEILKNLAYLMLYHKHLFEIKNYKESYDKIILYTFDKINYIKKLIRLIINKYELKIVKNKNWKHLQFMKILLGADDEGNPNIEHLKLDSNDFKLNKKDKEKDLNYQIFVNEDIQIDKFVYPKINYSELINYFKSYFSILGISINSLSYIFIKYNKVVDSPFTKQIEEKKIKIRFDIENKYYVQNNNISKITKQIPNEILKKYDDFCDKTFNIFNKFPVIIKFNPTFLIELYKFFLYSKDFLISCGEKYILKSILVLFNISFFEYYHKIFENINNYFKNKYNDGKDFLLDKIESVSIDNNINNIDMNNILTRKRLNSFKKNNSSTILTNTNNLKTTLDSNDLNKNNFHSFHSKSVAFLQENIGVEQVARTASIDESTNNIQNNDNLNINFRIIKNNDKNKIKDDNQLDQNIIDIIILIRKLLMEYITKSKNSLKIYNIINTIIEQSDNYENKIFLLFLKWKIINKDYVKRNEDINIFKSKRNIKNYFGGGTNNISIENFYPNKSISIKSPISNTNYIINNDYKKIPYKNMSKIIMKSIIPESQCQEVENILNKKHSQDNKKVFSIKEKYMKKDTNTFCFASTPNIALNEIKELENEDKDNFSGSEGENNNEENNIENEENNYEGKFIDENNDKNIPNLEELISVMHNQTKNNLYKYYSNNINERNNISHEINNIDKSDIYNEIEINVMYIINYNKKKSGDVHTTNFMKFLKILTSQEDETSFYRINEQKEFIYTDNFNISKYILNDNLQNNNQNNNYQICLIFNNTLENKAINNSSLSMNIDVLNNNEKIYLFLFIIPISNEFWKIEFKVNSKKKDEFFIKLKNILENNFLNCYILSIRNDFSYIVYHLKLLISLLQNLICIIKKDINDKKILNKLQGIKYEEIFKRINLFKSINL